MSCNSHYTLLYSCIKQNLTLSIFTMAITRDLMNIINAMSKDRFVAETSTEELMVSCSDDEDWRSIDIENEESQTVKTLYKKLEEMSTSFNILNKRYATLSSIVTNFQTELHSSIDKMSDIVEMASDHQIEENRKQVEELRDENKRLRESMYGICNIVTDNLASSNKEKDYVGFPNTTNSELFSKVTSPPPNRFIIHFFLIRSIRIIQNR